MCSIISFKTIKTIPKGVRLMDGDRHSHGAVNLLFLFHRRDHPPYSYGIFTGHGHGMVTESGQK